MRNATIDRYVERLLTESTPAMPIWNLEKARKAKSPYWNYVDGCMMTALWSLYEQTGEVRYRDFVANFYDYYVTDDGTPLGYTVEEYSVDHICSGRVLFDLYPVTKQEKLNRCIALLQSQLDGQPRIKEGSYWHKLIYPNQVWLDGLYMAQVFATRRALRDQDDAALADVSRQFALVRERLWVEEKKLYCHGYDESRSIFWADPVTGRSPGFWIRAMGWFFVAMADVLGYRPDDAIAAQLREACEGILPYLDEETSMFWQVVDQVGRAGNYPETSGSAMMAYTFLKGVRLGVLPAEYREIGKRIFEGICARYLTEDEDGLNLGGINLVSGLGPADNLRRDGSYEYYISEPVVNNDAKGVGPFLMCYTEILRAN